MKHTVIGCFVQCESFDFLILNYRCIFFLLTASMCQRWRIKEQINWGTLCNILCFQQNKLLVCSCRERIYKGNTFVIYLYLKSSEYEGNLKYFILGVVFPLRLREVNPLRYEWYYASYTYIERITLLERNGIFFFVQNDFVGFQIFFLS